jgi:hypothetical protein
MKRRTFLSLAAVIALGVGAFALLTPAALLASKGVAANAAADVWVREIGVALIAIGVTAWLLRNEPDSPALCSVLIGNAVLQLGLLPIEILAFQASVITRLDGIVPNSALHVLLAGGFIYYAAAMDTASPR